MRSLAILILLVTISGCASAPRSVDKSNIDAATVAAHQRQLSHIEGWEFQSRMAFINHLEDDRQSASMRWQHQADSRAIRISHPLRGTLARVEESSGEARLTDDQGNEFVAADIESLLAIHLNVVLPIELIEDALLGRIPDARIINPRYYEDGTLAQYEADITDDYATTSWDIELRRYQSASNAPYQLPHQLEMRSADYEIRLSISRWTVQSPSVSEMQ